MTEAEKLKMNQAGYVNSVQSLVDICYGLAKEAGWHDSPREDGTMIALIHSEVSEALEGLRKDLMDEHIPYRLSAEVELADAVIRIFDFAGKKGYDLGGALVDKLYYNTSRADWTKEARESANGKKF